MKSIYSFLFGTFSFFAVLLLGLMGCGSEGDDNPPPANAGFFKFKLDGVQQEFPVNDLLPMTFTYDAGGPVYNAVFQVLGEGSDGNSDFVNVLLRSETKFETGVDYQLQNGVPYKGIALARINFTYSDKSGQVFNAVLLQSSLTPLIINDSATIRFSKITETEAEGVFSAKVIGPVLPTGRGTVEKIVSEGQFKMRLLDNTN